MKQIFIRIKDTKSGRTLAKERCYSVASYHYNGIKFANGLKAGQEIEIAIGRQFNCCASFEELAEEDRTIYEYMTSYDIMYYVKQYLPTY